MFHKILCATDFSRGSTHALEVAARWAVANESSLEVVHVVAPLIALAPPSELLTEIHDTLRGDAEQRLADLVATLPAGARATGQVLDGFARDGIVAHAARTHADLVVVGTVSESTIARVMLGSTADRVVRTADCPVLVVPTTAASAVPRVILAPTDFSAAAKASVQLARKLASELSATVEVVHAYEVSFFDDLESPEARARAETLTEHARTFHELEASTRVHVVEGKAAASIERVAGSIGADLIVMGSGDHGAGTRWLLGSVTDRVLRTSERAVLVVHAARGEARH